jgi:hypothetical protein
LPDGYLAIFHKEKKVSVVVPPLGGLVWEFCDGQMTLAEVMNLVIDSATGHGELPENLSEQVNSLVDELLKDGFLQSVEVR